MQLAVYLCQSGLSVADFATQIGKTPQAVYRYISGDRIPARAVMRAISEKTAYAVTANDFMILENGPTHSEGEDHREAV